MNEHLSVDVVRTVPVWLQRPIARFGILFAIAAVLQAIVFRSYFVGQEIPPWDFLGSYNTDAFLWWEEGGFFAPPNWIPNVWAGYPSALNLQNSAWYLPVGIASVFGPFTLHSSAVVAALHVALGFAATYLLLRSFKQSFVVSCIFAVAGFFAVGYFSNAQHVDIARGYALIPLVLLVLSPTWPWRRVWATPLALLILWQALTGMYPGMIVTMVYVGVVWIAVYQFQTRSRFVDYLLPLSIAGLGAALLSAPRLVPYFLIQEGGAPPWPDGSVFSPFMIGTLLFGYSSGELPNDISMRSFFIPATAVLLAIFARRNDVISKQALAAGLPAALLGLPFLPWFDWVQTLPGLGLSRFTMSDFKPFIVIAVVLLAASGLTALSRLRGVATIPHIVRIKLAIAAGFCGLMAVVGIIGPFTRVDWFPPTVLLGLVFLAIAAYVLLRHKYTSFSVLACVLIVLTAASGLLWAFTTSATWKAPREAAEIGAYGSTVADLLAERNSEAPGEERPERVRPNDQYEIQDLRDVQWNRAYFTDGYSVGGYLNLKGSLTPEQLEAALLDGETGEDLMDFVAAPGRLFTSLPGAPVSGVQLAGCAATWACGEADVEAVRYESGRLEYKVSATQRTTALFNEAYYRGWSASACFADTECVDVSTSRSGFGLLEADLPKGDYRLVAHYETPGRLMGWLLFGSGVAIGIVAPLVVAWRASRERKQAL